MEYVEGQSLAAYLQARGRLTADETIRIGRQLADALAHAHGRGILHRDSKCANIACDLGGRPEDPRLRDCPTAGTGRQRSDAIRDAPGIFGDRGHSAWNMAPEVIRGEPQDERADLWSLGVVLTELLAGRRPFDGRNSYDLAAKITQGPAVQLPEGVPAPLAHVIGRLLSRDPASRYATAAETAAALEAVGDHTVPVPRRPRRARAVAGVVVVIVGLAVAAA